MTKTATNTVLDLRVGDIVEVRSEEEILRTLDSRGELDSLPFMPEMLEFCGKRFRVSKRADKVCDSIDWGTLRRMKNAVHLEGLRCNGAAHGGCKAGLFDALEGGLAEARGRLFERVDGARARPSLRRQHQGNAHEGDPPREHR